MLTCHMGLLNASRRIVRLLSKDASGRLKVEQGTEGKIEMTARKAAIRAAT